MQHNPGFKLCLFLPLLQCIIDKMMSPAFVSFTMLFKRISNSLKYISNISFIFNEYLRAFIFKYLRQKIHIIHKTLKQLRENKQTMYYMHLHTCVHVHCMGGGVWITVATLLTTLSALFPAERWHTVAQRWASHFFMWMMEQDPAEFLIPFMPEEAMAGSWKTTLWNPSRRCN